MENYYTEVALNNRVLIELIIVYPGILCTIILTLYYAIRRIIAEIRRPKVCVECFTPLKYKHNLRTVGHPNIYECPKCGHLNGGPRL